MKKIVLNVGQCHPDHGSISRLLTSHFDVDVVRANSHSETLQLVQEQSFDLILINRVLDADGSSGMELLSLLKSNAATSNVPVMLVSNYADAQAAAVATGAVSGFGKNSLNAAATLTELKKYLA